MNKKTKCICDDCNNKTQGLYNHYCNDCLKKTFISESLRNRLSNSAEQSKKNFGIWGESNEQTK